MLPGTKTMTLNRYTPYAYYTPYRHNHHQDEEEEAPSTSYSQSSFYNNPLARSHDNIPFSPSIPISNCDDANVTLAPPTPTSPLSKYISSNRNYYDDISYNHTNSNDLFSTSPSRSRPAVSITNHDSPSSPALANTGTIIKLHNLQMDCVQSMVNLRVSNAKSEKDKEGEARVRSLSNIVNSQSVKMLSLTNRLHELDLLPKHVEYIDKLERGYKALEDEFNRVNGISDSYKVRIDSLTSELEFYKATDEGLKVKYEQRKSIRCGVFGALVCRVILDSHQTRIEDAFKGLKIHAKKLRKYELIVASSLIKRKVKNIRKFFDAMCLIVRSNKRHRFIVQRTLQSAVRNTLRMDFEVWSTQVKAMKRHRVVIYRFKVNVTKKSLYSVFNEWMNFVALRQKLRRIVVKMTTKIIQAGFKRWSAVVNRITTSIIWKEEKRRSMTAMNRAASRITNKALYKSFRLWVDSTKLENRRVRFIRCISMFLKRMSMSEMNVFFNKWKNMNSPVKNNDVQLLLKDYANREDGNTRKVMDLEARIKVLHEHAANMKLKALNRFIQASSKNLIRVHFKLWSELTERRKKRSAAMLTFINHMVKGEVVRGFESWRCFVDAVKREEVVIRRFRSKIVNGFVYRAYTSWTSFATTRKNLRRTLLRCLHTNLSSGFQRWLDVHNYTALQSDRCRACLKRWKDHVREVKRLKTFMKRTFDKEDSVAKAFNVFKAYSNNVKVERLNDRIASQQVKIDELESEVKEKTDRMTSLEFNNSQRMVQRMVHSLDVINRKLDDRVCRVFLQRWKDCVRVYNDAFSNGALAILTCIHKSDSRRVRSAMKAWMKYVATSANIDMKTKIQRAVNNEVLVKEKAGWALEMLGFRGDDYDCEYEYEGGGEVYGEVGRRDLDFERYLY